MIYFAIWRKNACTHRVCFSLIAIGLTIGSSVAFGAFVAPAKLPPGEKYHLLFNSSTLTTGASPNIANYNNVAQQAANSAGIGSSLGINWKAVLSTTSVNAKDNAVIGVNTPVYNMLGESVATGAADLWDGTIAAGPMYDEFGVENSEDAWTGSTTSGTIAAGLALGSPNNAWCGKPSFLDSRWLQRITPPVTTRLHVYALSQELVVVAPPGDFNEDGIVDAADYTVWRDSPTRPASDYTLWKNNFGATSTAVSVVGSAISASPVPEPAGEYLLATAIAFLIPNCHSSSRRSRRAL